MKLEALGVDNGQEVWNVAGNGFDGDMQLYFPKANATKQYGEKYPMFTM